MSEKKLQLLKRICLSLIFCLFVLLSVVLPEQTVTAQQAGWTVTLDEGKTTSSMLTINNRCSAPHTFRIKEDIKYLSFQESTESMLIAPGSPKPLNVKFDATGLKPKVYKDKLIVECLDCKKEKGCIQDKDQIPVQLTVKPSVSILQALPNITSIQKGDVESNSSKTLIGYGSVKGIVNDITFAATYESKVDRTTGEGLVVVKGIPKEIGPGLASWTVLNVTVVCLLGAKEENGGINFLRLTDGKYSRDLSIQMPNGETLNTTATLLQQPDGRVQVDIMYSGRVMSVQGMKALPSSHTIIQGPSGTARLAGTMKVKLPNSEKVLSAPIISEFTYQSGKTLPAPMELTLVPIETTYDPTTQTITIRVRETIMRQKQ